MRKPLLPATAFVLASSLVVVGCRETSSSAEKATVSAAADSARWGQEDTMSAAVPADAAQNPAEPTPSVPDEPARSPASVPDEVEELPEAVAMTSICLLNNIENAPVIVQPELPTTHIASEELGYLDKTVVDIPREVASPVLFSVWLKKNNVMRARCPLKRGGSYQVFINKRTRKLAIAPMPSS